MAGKTIKTMFPQNIDRALNEAADKGGGKIGRRTGKQEIIRRAVSYWLSKNGFLRENHSGDA